MKKFSVFGPITGTFYIEVEAENEKDAIEVALDNLEAANIEDWDIVSKHDFDVEVLEDTEDTEDTA